MEVSNEDYSFKKSGVEGKEKWETREYGRIKGWLDILKKDPLQWWKSLIHLCIQQVFTKHLYRPDAV